MRVTTARDLGNVVHDRRKALGLTQAELAARAGVSRLWVNQFEGGHPGASLVNVLRVLKVIELAVDVAVIDDPADTPAPARSRASATTKRRASDVEMPAARRLTNQA